MPRGKCVASSVIILLSICQSLAYPQQRQPRQKSRNAVESEHFLSTTLNHDLIEDIRGSIEIIITNDPVLAPKFVRLQFHQCVGGCNGCVDISNPENAGLLIPINALEPVVEMYNDSLSRADIWTISAFHAAEMSSGRQHDRGGSAIFGNYQGDRSDFPILTIGRVDCDADPSAICVNMEGESAPCSAVHDNHHEFPTSHFSTSELVDYFAEEFDFVMKETVAILGAHTLGTATRSISGIDGGSGWVPSVLVLDNEYYQDLVAGENPNTSNLTELADAADWFVQRQTNRDLQDIQDTFVWLRGDPSTGVLRGGRNFMLNIDIAIVRDFHEQITPRGRVTCEFSPQKAHNVCPFAESTIRQAAQYRLDNDLWMRDFRDAFTKMSQNGYDIIEDGDDNRRRVVPAEGLCFSGRSMLETENGDRLSMSDLRVGDKVQAHDGSYSEVYGFGHRHPDAVARYLQIHLRTTVIELSLDHLIEVDGKFVPASLVSVGDVLSNGEQVLFIRKIELGGIFAPLTRSGTLVVNGIVCSNYVSLQRNSGTLTVGSIETGLSWHWIQHSFMTALSAVLDAGELNTEGIPWRLQFLWKTTLWLLDFLPLLLQLCCLILSIGLADRTKQTKGFKRISLWSSR